MTSGWNRPGAAASEETSSTLEAEATTGIGAGGIGKSDPLKAGGPDVAMPLRPRAGRRATSPRS